MAHWGRNIGHFINYDTCELYWSQVILSLWPDPPLYHFNYLNTLEKSLLKDLYSCFPVVKPWVILPVRVQPIFEGMNCLNVYFKYFKTKMIQNFIDCHRLSCFRLPWCRFVGRDGNLKLCPSSRRYNDRHSVPSELQSERFPHSRVKNFISLNK